MKDFIQLWCFAILLTQVFVASNHADSKSELSNQYKDEFVFIDGKQYYIAVSGKVKWNDAMNACNSLNMKLVTLLTEDKYLSIETFMKTYPSGLDAMWTSGIRHDDVTFLWSALGVELNFVKWGLDQPSMLQDEVCLANHAGDGLNDHYCSDLLSYMCEHPCAL